MEELQEKEIKHTTNVNDSDNHNDNNNDNKGSLDYINSFFSGNEETDSDSESNPETDAESITDWLNEQRELDADYNEFYPEIPTSIQLYFLYVSKENELEGIGKETHILESYGKVSNESLSSIIEKRKDNSNKIYKVCNILQYNITASPREILEKEDTTDSYNNYFNEVDISNTIRFNETICVLQDLNSLFVILKEIIKPQPMPRSSQSKHKFTRRIKFKKAIKSHSTRRKRA